eukprot:COSAG02_NODE_31474_length_533_cov_0.691244_1_plen_164_part_00
MASRLRNISVQLTIGRVAGDESTAAAVGVVEAEAETSSRPQADKPDIGVPNSAYAMARMEDETTPYLIHSMSPEGACKALISDPEDLMKGWATVTRGDPPAHLLPADQLPAACAALRVWQTTGFSENTFLSIKTVDLLLIEMRVPYYRTHTTPTPIRWASYPT